MKIGNECALKVGVASGVGPTTVVMKFIYVEDGIGTNLKLKSFT